MKNTTLFSLLFFLSFFSFAQTLEKLNEEYIKAYQAGDYKNAIVYAEKARKQAETELGKEHPEYVIPCNDLAFLYYSQGRYAEAEPLYLEAKAIRAKALGTEHPDYAISCNSLAALYDSQGRYV